MLRPFLSLCIIFCNDLGRIFWLVTNAPKSIHNLSSWMDKKLLICNSFFCFMYHVTNGINRISKSNYIIPSYPQGDRLFIRLDILRIILHPCLVIKDMDQWSYAAQKSGLSSYGYSLQVHLNTSKINGPTFVYHKWNMLVSFPIRHVNELSQSM